MSGLYNMVFGHNRLAGTFLAELGLSPHDVPRFRDCFLYHDGQSIVVYTRTGGGNREEYREENEVMTRRAGYLRDEDDHYDETYALFHFAIPESIKPHVPKLLEKGYGVDPAKRWAKAIEEIGKKEP